MIDIILPEYNQKPIFAVHDYETTGLTIHPQGELEKQPRAIEFAGIITDGDEILFQLEFICNPGIAIEEIITRITGLTNADLRDKPPFEYFVPQLKDYFGRANISLAHNLSFDQAISEYDLQRLGLTLADINYPKYKCCTVEQTLPLYGRRMKLEQLYNMHCGTYVQKHRALDDILLLHEFCKKTGVYEAYKGNK